jgi:excinuclease UvrABC ATPase subunit
VSVDQAAIRGSRRSNPAMYIGLLDPIRKAFAASVVADEPPRGRPGGTPR